MQPALRWQLKLIEPPEQGRAPCRSISVKERAGGTRMLERHVDEGGRLPPPWVQPPALQQGWGTINSALMHHWAVAHSGEGSRHLLMLTDPKKVSKCNKPQMSEWVQLNSTKELEPAQSRAHLQTRQVHTIGKASSVCRNVATV